MQRVRVLKAKRRKKILSNRAWVLAFMAENGLVRTKKEKSRIKNDWC